MINVTPVILCGGSGTRLWPLSRTGFPKQFLCLTGQESLFQQAALRLGKLGNEEIQVASTIIVTGEDHRFLASEQLREIGIELGCALLEPVGRNTAPALTLAALAAMDGSADPVLVVTPADQTVVNGDAFTSAMQQAVAEAANGTIVILGVTPDKPETGYSSRKLRKLRSVSTEPAAAHMPGCRPTSSSASKSWKPRTAVSNGCMRIWRWRMPRSRMSCRESCDADSQARSGGVHGV